MKATPPILGLLTVRSSFLVLALVLRALGSDWPTETTLTLRPPLLSVGNPITFKSTTTGTLGKGAEVTFYIDGKEVGKASAGSDGKAEWSFMMPALTAGTREAIVRFPSTFFSEGYETVTHYDYDAQGRVTRVWTTQEFVRMYLAASSGSASFTVGDSAPLIASQPTNQIVAAGSKAQFTTEVWGTLPLVYQWRFGDKPLAGATNGVLAIPGSLADQAGAYSLVVSNPLGSVASSNALLTVFSVRASLPAGEHVAVNEGSTVTFAVSASGGLPLSYAWAKNGSKIVAQTSSTLTLEDVAAGDGGA